MKFIFWLMMADAGRKIKSSVTTLSLPKSVAVLGSKIPRQVPTLFKGLLENYISIRATVLIVNKFDFRPGGLTGTVQGW